MNTNPNPQDEVLLTKKDLEAYGIADVESLQVILRDALKKGKDQEEITKINEALSDSIKSLTEATNALKSEIVAKNESAKFDEASASALLATFKGLDKRDPNRQLIVDELSKEFGVGVASVITEGSYKTALHRPIHKGHSQYESLAEFRRAHDFAHIMTAADGAISEGTKDGGKMDLEIFKSKVAMLARAGMPGAVSVLKAINEAMDTATATEGSEWVPTNMSSQLADDVWLNMTVAPLFRRIPMPTKSYDVPMRTARGRGYRMSEATTYNQFFTVLATAHGQESTKATFTAEKLAALQYLSDELVSDAVLPTLDMAYEDVVWAIAECVDDAIVNGSVNTNDLDNANTDTNRLWANTADAGDGIRLNTGSADCRNSWNGLRALVRSTGKVSFGNADPTWALIVSVLKAMGKYSTKKQDLAMLVSVKTHSAMLNSISELVTLEKYGSNATILTGEVGRVGGIPVVPTAHLYENVNASGVFDNVTTNRTNLLIVNRRCAALGDRMQVRLESERQKLAGQIAVLATARMDFQALVQAHNNNPWIGQGYNVATA